MYYIHIQFNTTRIKQEKHPVHFNDELCVNSPWASCWLLDWAVCATASFPVPAIILSQCGLLTSEFWYAVEIANLLLWSLNRQQRTTWRDIAVSSHLVFECLTIKNRRKKSIFLPSRNLHHIISSITDLILHQGSDHWFELCVDGTSEKKTN